MAIVLATVSLDMSNLNSNAGLSSDNSTLFYDNQPFTSDGFIYMDTVRVISDGGTRYSDYAGPELWHDPYSGMSGGLITGIFAGAYSTGNQLVIQGIALPVADLGSATATSATTDDFAVFASIFAGSDLFSLSDAGDVAYGFTGKDSIYGFGGHDWLYGLHGNDLLRGHDGSDLLDGGQGRDKLTGGRGNDVFQFTVLKDGGDKITDFHRQRGDNDLFVFGKASFRGAGSGELDATQFQASTTNVAEDIDTRFIFRTTDETLWFDKNGSRAGGLTLIADLQNNAAVSHDDILLL